VCTRKEARHSVWFMPRSPAGVWHYWKIRIRYISYWKAH